MADYAKGYKYQRSVTAYLASVLSKNKMIKDYRIFYEVQKLYPFDDIVLAVNYHESDEHHLYFIQVKSGKINKRKTEIELLSKYLNGYNKIMKNKSWKCLGNIGQVSEENIQCWYFACENLSSETISLQEGSKKKRLEIKRCISDSDESIIHNQVYELFSKDGDVTNEHQKYCNHFYIFLQQPNSYIIANKLKDMWKSINAVQIIEYIDKFFTKNKNGSVSKTDFERELLKTCLSDSIVIPTKVMLFQKESALAWNNLTLSYNVTIVKSELDIESCLFGCILQNICDEITIDQWNAFVGDGGRLSKQFKKQFAYKSLKPETLKDLLFQYWIRGKVPLIIKANNPLPLLKDFSHLDRRYIIIDADPDKRYDEMKSYDLTVLKNLGETRADQLLQSIMVSMQGREPSSLYEVTNGDRNLMEALTCLDILKLMEPRQVYVCHDYMLFIIETANPEPMSYEDYEPNGDNISIYCHLHQSNEVYQKVRRDPKFQNYNIYRLQLEDKLKPASRGRLPSSPLDDENIDLPLTFYENKLYKSIRELEAFLIDQQGNSVYSSNEDTVVPIIGQTTRITCPKYLSRHMRKGIVVEKRSKNASAYSYVKFTPNAAIIFSDDNFFKEMNGKICVVTGEAGIGKTTFLQSLRQTCDPQKYVLFYNLARIQKDIWKNTEKLLQDPLNFLWRMQQPLTYTHFFNELQKDRKRLVLILDSFDEVIPTCKEQVLELIRKLNGEVGLEKIIIGCRFLAVNILNKQFNIEVCKIEGFSNKYNGQYLENWNFNEDNLQEIPTVFVTNPLYLDMLREISQTSDIDLRIISRWTLYERIVDSKIQRYCQRIGHVFDEYERNNIMKFYWELAVKFIFGSNRVTEQFTLNKQLKFSNLSRLGFVKYFNENDEPVFVHHTFAEFFAANWLIKTQNQEDAKYIYGRILEEHESDVLRMHSEQFALHKVILNTRFGNNTIEEQIETLCSQNKELLLQKDGIGRTALHIAIIYYSFYSRKGLETIIQCMREVGYDLYLRDKLLNRTWIDYWENKSWKGMERFFYSSFTIQEAYWRYYASHVKTISLSHIWENINFIEFYKCVILYPTLFNIIGDMLSVRYSDNQHFIRFRNLCMNSEVTARTLPQYFQLDELQLTPLHLAAIYSNMRVVIACLERGDNINAVDNFRCTPLYYSVGKQECEIVKLLLQKGADVLLHPYLNLGVSTFQLSLQKGNNDITQMLIKRIDINKVGAIWLYDAIKFGNTEVIETILKANANPNAEIPLNKHGRFENEICRRDMLKTFRRFRAYGYDVSAMTIDHLLLFADACNNIYSLQFLPDKYFMRLLNVAIHARRKDIVELLLKNGADVNQEVNCKGKTFISGTPLCCAIRHRSVEMIELLLENGANVNDIDKHGLTPLRVAMKEDDKTLLCFMNDKAISLALTKYCNHIFDCIEFMNDIFDYDWTLSNPTFLQRNLQLLELLLRHGADVNLNNNEDSTPLDDAIATRNWVVAEYLLENGANLKQFDFMFCLALVPPHNLKVVELLLKNGVDPNPKTACDMSPLYVAARKRNPDMVELLFEYGASANIVINTKMLLAKAKEKSDFNTVRLLWILDEVCSFGPIDNSAYPAKVVNLIRIVENQPHINLVKEINTIHDSSNAKLAESLLLYAVDRLNPNGMIYVDTVLALNSKVVDEALLCNFKHQYKGEILGRTTAVGCAAKHRNKAMIKILARNGEDVNSVNKYGCTALVSVIESHMDKRVVEFLMDNQADVNLADKSGKTPLITAISYNKTNIVKILLEHNAIVNYIDKAGLTPLIVAINEMNLNIIRSLLDNNADVNFVSNSGLTPLYSTVMKGDETIIEMILNYRPKTNIETCGSTLLFNAIRSNYAEIVDLLLSKTCFKCKYVGEYYDVVEKICLNRANVNAVNELGSTPLHLATEVGNCRMVWSLLNCNADPNQVDKYGRTALHYAIDIKKTDILKNLLRKKADVNIKDNNGLTPLDYAKTNDNSDIIDILQKKEEIIGSSLLNYSFSAIGD